MPRSAAGTRPHWWWPCSAAPRLHSAPRWHAGTAPAGEREAVGNACLEQAWRSWCLHASHHAAAKHVCRTYEAGSAAMVHNAMSVPLLGRAGELTLPNACTRQSDTQGHLEGRQVGAQADEAAQQVGQQAAVHRLAAALRRHQRQQPVHHTLLHLGRRRQHVIRLVTSAASHRTQHHRR